MIDASRSTEDDEPNDFESNVAVTRSVVDVAHARGVSVEGELGTIGGAEAGMTGVIEEIGFMPIPPRPRSSWYGPESTPSPSPSAPATAQSSSPTSLVVSASINLIAEIKNRLPDTALVLHGSSSIPVDAGRGHQWGRAAQSRPTASTQRRSRQAFRRASARSISIGFTPGLDRGAADRASANVPLEVEPSSALAAAMAAMTEIVRERMRQFGSLAGQAR